MPDREISLIESALGRRLANLRKAKGLTQKDLAQKLGVTQSVVSDYERAQLRLHGELIIQLVSILKVSADELLGIATKPAAN